MLAASASCDSSCFEPFRAHSSFYSGWTTRALVQMLLVIKAGMRVEVRMAARTEVKIDERSELK